MRERAAVLMSYLPATLAHTKLMPFSAKINSGKRKGQTHIRGPMSALRSLDVLADFANPLWEGI
jgi:hypothetical protein